MSTSSAAHPAHGSQGFLLLTINNVEATLPGENTPIIDQLALECVTVPGNPSSSSSPDSERDVWLILRVGPNEMVISPTQVVRHFRSQRKFIFEGRASGAGAESKWMLQLPTPHGQTELEDLETFEVILAQYAAVEEMDMNGSPPTYSDVVSQTVANTATPQAKRPVPQPPALSGFETPPLPPRPASQARKERHTDDLKGRLVLVDEDDGEVVGTLGEQFNIHEDGAMSAKGHEKDPVIIDIPADGETTRATEVYVYPVPFEQQDTVMKTASFISQGMVFATSAISAGLGAASSFYIAHSKPNEKPLEFSERTRENVRSVHTISGKAVKVTAKTTGLIHDALEIAVDYVSGGSKDKGKSRATTPTPGAPDTPPRPLPLKNRLFIATDMLLTTAERSAKELLEQGTLHASEALGHKYGKDMRDASYLIGHSARNVGIVYIDARGVGRRALLKKAGARYVKAKLGTKDVVLGIDQNGVMQQTKDGSTPSTAPLHLKDTRSVEGLSKDRM